MFLLLDAFLLLFAALSGNVEAEEANDSDLINRLLHEVERLKLQHVKTNEKYENMKIQQVKTDEKYEILHHEFLDLKKEQVKWEALRKEMEDTNNECRSLLEKFKNMPADQQPFSKAHGDLHSKLDPDDIDSYKNNSASGASVHSDRIRKRIVPPSSQVTATNGVAFYADLTHDITTLGRLHPIVYDRVKTNIGSAYNNNDGIFTAPLSGVYVFSWYGMASQTHLEELDIVVDGQFFTRSYSANTYYESASKTVVIDLNKGSVVWIRTSANNGHGFVAGSFYNAFTGWLLYPRDS